MTALLTENLPLLVGAPNGIKKLRELILELAVRGKLVPQDPSDEPASDLLKRIAEEKARLVAEGKIRKQKPLAEISEEEKPFELPVSWTWSRLGSQVIESGAGWSPSCEPRPREDNEWGVLKVSAVSWGVYQPEENKALPENLEARPEHEVAEGDFLVSRANTAELVARSVVVETTPGHLMLSDKIVRLKLTSLCERRYVNLANSAPLARDYYSRVAGGTSSSMKNVSREQILNLPLALPPLAEQHRIVAKVDELMALCDRLEAQQADAESAHTQLVQALLDSLTQASDANDFAANWQRLAEHFHTLFTTEPSIDALKQTLLQLAVMGKLVPQDPSDEPAESLLQRNGIKSQPHTLQGWAEAPLGHLGKILGGSTPSKANAEFWSGDIPWVSPKDMKRPVIHDSEDHISAKALAETSLKAVPPKSLLMVVRGMILVHSFPVALTAREVTINQDMKALVPPEEISDYLLMYLQATKAVMVGLVDRSSHGTCKLISEKLWSHIVCLPPLPEQHRIVAKIDQLMALCDQLKTRLTQARQLNEQLASTLVEQAVA